MPERSPSPVPGVAEHPSLALVDSASDVPGGTSYDDLATPESATAWLVAHGLIASDAEVYEHCRGRLAQLREDLRALFSAHVAGEAPAPAAVDALNRALTSAPGALRLHFDPTTGFTRTADHPVTQIVEHVMAVIAEDAASFLSGTDAAALASCEADSCRWFFLRTHARRQWCSNRCGDRMRAARAYARKRAASGQPA